MEDIKRLKKRATLIKYSYITIAIIFLLILLRYRHLIGEIEINNFGFMLVLLVTFVLPLIYFLIDDRIRSNFYRPRGFIVLSSRSKRTKYMMFATLVALVVVEFLSLYFDLYRNIGPAIGITIVLLYQLISEKVYVNESRFSVKYFEGEIKHIHAIRKGYGVKIILNYEDKDMQVSLPNKDARDTLYEYITQSDEFNGIVYT